MGHSNEAVVSKDNVTLGALSPRLFRMGILAGIVGLGGAAALGIRAADHGERLMHTYLVSFMFCMSLALGGLFFTILQHLTRAGWSASVRRIAELLAGTLPVMAVLALPIVVPMLMGNAGLYEWVDHSLVEHDHLLHKKAAYLNVPFFVVRFALFFAIWTVLSRFFLRRSTAQDTSGDPVHTVRMQSASPVAMLLFGISITFFSFDFMMTLSPRWFSTMFGVYYFGGTLMSMFAIMSLIAMGLQRSGRLVHSVSQEHYHDLGKLLFAFVFFWGYIAFSQFMLIWYANVPEETEWYLHRMQGPWAYVSLLLLFGHFVIPFLGLISRHVKRNRKGLAFWAVYLLVMHWVDLYWLVMPSFDEHHTPFGLMDICCFIGLAGLLMATWAYLARRRPLIALKDPRMNEALAFENV